MDINIIEIEREYRINKLIIEYEQIKHWFDSNCKIMEYYYPTVASMISELLSDYSEDERRQIFDALISDNLYEEYRAYSPKNSFKLNFEIQLNAYNGDFKALVIDFNYFVDKKLKPSLQNLNDDFYNEERIHVTFGQYNYKAFFYKHGVAHYPDRIFIDARLFRYFNSTLKDSLYTYSNALGLFKQILSKVKNEYPLIDMIIKHCSRTKFIEKLHNDAIIEINYSREYKKLQTRIPQIIVHNGYDINDKPCVDELVQSKQHKKLQNIIYFNVTDGVIEDEIL